MHCAESQNYACRYTLMVRCYGARGDKPTSSRLFALALSWVATLGYPVAGKQGVSEEQGTCAVCLEEGLRLRPCALMLFARSLGLARLDAADN